MKRRGNHAVANTTLLQNLTYLENLLTAMQQKITRMTSLSNSIKNEELYYTMYEPNLNLFKVPKELHFQAKRKLFAWFVACALLCSAVFGPEKGAVGAMFVISCIGCLYLMKRKRSRILSAIVWGITFSYGTICLFTLMLTNTNGFPLLSPRGFLAAFILAYVVTYFCSALFIKGVNAESDSSNDAIERQNETIRAKNQELMEQCNALNTEVQALQTQVAEAVRQMNYPPDYVCLDAVRFFIHALRNDRADSFRRLIDLYESNNYRRRMLESQQELAGIMQQQVYNQERIGQLLVYSNCLNAVNLATQIQTQTEIRALRQSVSTAPYSY